MKYDVYFHNDFDGRASAAIFWDFLRKRGDGVGQFYAVDHGDKLALNWEKVISKSKNKVAIFDFYYHPRATFWFDHHRTTFKKTKWQKVFKQTKFHILKPEYLSCCRLVMDYLRKNFGYKPSEHVRELAKWLEVVDGARYKSPKQAIEIKEPALQIDAYIDENSSGGKPLEWLIESLSRKSLRSLANDKRVRSATVLVRKKIKAGLVFQKKHLQIYDRVAFVDLSSNVYRVRFGPHYLYPKLNYVITMLKTEGMFRISVGGNPWRRSSCNLDLGDLVRKKYGGGGHKYAAGIAGIKSRGEALRIVNELIQILGK
ncbi:MAG: phosphoesterase DHHA1 [Parcubacteria group bacterium Gr01-1014_20]|nr:MAG: phosphoesterase DHHA1 [Parcubacteria group bacterium Gr01-1014_20]